MTHKLIDKIIIYVLIVILIMATFIIVVKADTNIPGYLTTNGVRLRSSASTSGSILVSNLGEGTTVNIVDTTKIRGAGCDDGWYHVTYNGRDGYICSTYVTTDSNKKYSYGRPWTSPKKAIYGGAAFIASGYIAKGQDNLYLQRYNVNPNGYYTVHNHQYATDVAYASTQARILYNQYKNNNLLDMPLHFEIPIFENMPEYSAHPDNGVKKGGTSTISDGSFENELINQGFSESYRIWLRDLHNKHPNWTFSSICTGLDFNTAVDIQKNSSLVEKAYCNGCAGANSYGAWYYATSSGVAYYLDPRNFLDEQNVLMFTRLSYDSKYKDAAAGLLNGTFMSGYDSVDNESYASIFDSAGKTYNINPVYLEAKAIVENGRNGSVQTSGASLSFNGATYVGIYNFYSIGATDSLGSAGGVAYAAMGLASSGGSYVGNIGGSPILVDIGSNDKYTSKNVCSQNKATNDVSREITSDNTATQISALGLKSSNNIITGLNNGTTAKNLLNKVSNITIKNKDGAVLSGNEKIATGYTITFVGGETYPVVIYGDISGDGDIDSVDLLQIRKYLLGTINLEGVYLEAAKLANQGNIDSVDLLKMRQYLLGTGSIRTS